MRIDDARDVGDPLPQQGDLLLVALAVAPQQLHVDLRRHAEIQHLRHQVGRLEIEQHFGKIGRAVARAACG